MKVITAADVLREARSLLEERGWGPLGSGTSIYQAVVLAALGRALGEGGPFEDEAHWQAAIDGPCRFIDRLIAPMGFAGIAHWEMAEERTQAEVLAVFELAIAGAERVFEPAAVAA